MSAVFGERSRQALVSMLTAKQIETEEEKVHVKVHVSGWSITCAHACTYSWLMTVAHLSTCK